MNSMLSSIWHRFRFWVSHNRDSSYTDWFLRFRPDLEKFAGLHAGEDCFLIGNGPSLNRTDLSALKGYHAIGLNKIHLIFARCPVDLSYHVAVNPYVIEQSFQDFERYSCPSFLSYNNTQVAKRSGGLFYLYTHGAPLCFSESVLQRISEGWTVTFVALQIAYFMGFRRVYLIGVDHSFQVKGNPNEMQVLQGEDVNHFAPNYFQGKEWQLPDLEGSEMAYRLAKFAFDRAGREILDATIGGKLDIFKKVEFSEALDQCRPRQKPPVRCGV